MIIKVSSSIHFEGFRLSLSGLGPYSSSTVFAVMATQATEEVCQKICLGYLQKRSCLIIGISKVFNYKTFFNSVVSSVSCKTYQDFLQNMSID